MYQALYLRGLSPEVVSRVHVNLNVQAASNELNAVAESLATLYQQQQQPRWE